MYRTDFIRTATVQPAKPDLARVWIKVDGKLELRWVNRAETKSHAA